MITEGFTRMDVKQLHLRYDIKPSFGLESCSFFLDRIKEKLRKYTINEYMLLYFTTTSCDELHCFLKLNKTLVINDEKRLKVNDHSKVNYFKVDSVDMFLSRIPSNIINLRDHVANPELWGKYVKFSNLLTPSLDLNAGKMLQERLEYLEKKFFSAQEKLVKVETELHSTKKELCHTKVELSRSEANLNEFLSLQMHSNVEEEKDILPPTMTLSDEDFVSLQLAKR